MLAFKPHALVVGLALLVVSSLARGGPGPATPRRGASARMQFEFQKGRSNYSDREKRALTRTLRSVSRMTGLAVTPPPRVVIDGLRTVRLAGSSESPQAKVDLTPPLIRVALDPRGPRFRPVSAAGALAITVHEFAHVVFDAGFEARSPRYAAHRAVRRRLAALDDQRSRLRQTLRRSRESTSAGTVSEAGSNRVDEASVERRLAKLEARALALLGSPAGKLATQVKRFSLPYTELFADAVAYLHFEEGDILARALENHDGSPDVLRDFSHRHSDRATAAAVRPSGSALEGYIGREAQGVRRSELTRHGRTAPIRSLIGRTYERRRRQGRDPRPEMLNALLRASVAELEAQMDSGYQSLSIAVLNRGLRQRLLADPEFTGRPPAATAMSPGP